MRYCQAMSNAPRQTLRRQPEQARARKNLSAMLDAAAQLINGCGTDGFSMAELARRAGVSKPALYRYFPNKQAVLLALARASFEQNHALLRDSLERNPGDLNAAMREAMHRYCALHRSEPFRIHLRAAMHADPELMALDFADSRHNAGLVEEALRSQFPSLDAVALRHHLMLIMGCSDAVALMTIQVDDDEAEQLIERFVHMSTASLPLGQQL